MSHHHQYVSPDRAHQVDESWKQTAPWWWNQRSPAKPLPSPPKRMVWPLVVAGLAALALLTAFQQVVAQVVVQADRDRAAAAVNLELASTCKLMHDAVMRVNCLSDLSAAHRLRTPSHAQAPVMIARTSGDEPARD